MTPPTVTDEAPADRAEVERIVRASGTSFYRGMRILPPERRAAMYAIYAFCRIVDDIADEPADTAIKITQLDTWRARIAALYAGTADDPVTRTLRAAIQRFGLRAPDFIAIIDGMQTDAEHIVVAPSLAELDLYCDRVAAAVGRLSVRAFGDASQAADEVAWSLGRALQYTNILRDLDEDGQRGRLYLPAEFLTEAGIPHDAASALSHPNLPIVCTRMVAAARAYFAAARAAMKNCDRRAMRPARLMEGSYLAQLDALERRGWTRLAERPIVPKLQKLLILARNIL